VICGDGEMRWKWSFIVVDAVGDESFKKKRKIEKMREMRKRRMVTR